MKSAQELVAEANAQVETIPVEEAKRLVGDPNVVFVDIREASEAEASGQIEGSIAVPRGLLEFRVDPTSPLHQPELDGKKLVLYCAASGRSALAAKALQDMGIENVAHLEGGYTAWKKAQD